MKLFFAQKALIVHDGKILLLQNSARHKWATLQWTLPGGRIEVGEILDHSLRREVMEETGLEIVPGKVYDMWERLDDEAHIVGIARICKPITFEAHTRNITPSDNIECAVWVPFAEVPKLDLAERTKKIILDFVKSQLP